MNRKTIVFGTAFLVALTATTLAYATEPSFPRTEGGFARLDADKDGKLARAELQPMLERRRALVDSNKDRIVTAAEIEAAMQARLAKRRDRILQLLDSNRDGQVTEAELDKLAEDMFNSADADGDGGLTVSEIRGFKRAAWRQARIGKPAPQ